MLDGLRRSWITDASLIAIAPFYGYLLAYVYQLGFCLHFDIPMELLRIDIGYILAMAPVGTVCIPLIMIAITTFEGRGQDFKSYSAPLGIVLGTVVLIAVPLFLMYSSASYVWPFVSMVLLSIVLNRAWRGGFVYLIRWRHRSSGTGAKPDAATLERSQRLYDIILVTAYIVAVLGIAMYGGFSRAKNNENFLVCSKIPNMVVLRIYGQYAIFAPVDTMRRVTFPRYRIMEVKDEIIGTMAWKHLGPLQPLPRD